MGFGSLEVKEFFRISSTRLFFAEEGGLVAELEFMEKFYVHKQSIISYLNIFRRFQICG